MTYGYIIKVVCPPVLGDMYDGDDAVLKLKIDSIRDDSYDRYLVAHWRDQGKIQWQLGPNEGDAIRFLSESVATELAYEVLAVIKSYGSPLINRRLVEIWALEDARLCRKLN